VPVAVLEPDADVVAVAGPAAEGPAAFALVDGGGGVGADILTASDDDSCERGARSGQRETQV
jgi:hypothetical protein